MSNKSSQDKPVRRRATEIEVKQRTRDVVRMLMDLNSLTEIRAYMKDKYDCNLHSANRYIKLANEEIKKHHKPVLQTIINSHVKKYHEIARRNEQEDPRTSILAMQALEKLLRLTGSGEGRTYNTQINLNLEEVETQQLMELLEKIKVDDDAEIIEKTGEDDYEEIQDE